MLKIGRAACAVLVLAGLILGVSCYNPVYNPNLSLGLSRDGYAPGAKSIDSFEFPAQGAVGVIDQGTNSISVTVPFGANLSSLVPKLRFKGAKVYPDSGTAHSFQTPQPYYVTAVDGTTRGYMVTVVAALNSAALMTDFRFLASINAPLGLYEDCVGSITGNTINVTFPYGTAINAPYYASFTASPGASVYIGGTLQSSGTMQNNFSGSLTYTVVSADGKASNNFTVYVTSAPSNLCDLTAFSFAFSLNVAAGLAADSYASISGTDVYILVTSGANLGNLVAAFSVSSGATVKIGGTLQASNSSYNDFSSALDYAVIAADGVSVKHYTVYVGHHGSASFAAIGAAQAFTVPTAVTSIAVDAAGAQGAGGIQAPSHGGYGGRVQGSIAVTPLETLEVNVGTQAGWNGGGAAGTTGPYSSYLGKGNGGGASDIRQGGSALTNRILVAAGGGGMGSAGSFSYSGTDSWGGDGGGSSGSDGLSGNAGSPGLGATPTGPGLASGAATAYGATPGTDGAFGLGGDGGSAMSPGTPYQAAGDGGGGGGGYYGGSGGAAGITGGGGGGGSSLFPAGGTTTAGFQSGDGYINLSW